MKLSIYTKSLIWQHSCTTFLPWGPEIYNFGKQFLDNHYYILIVCLIYAQIFKTLYDYYGHALAQARNPNFIPKVDHIQLIIVYTFLIPKLSLTGMGGVKKFSFSFVSLPYLYIKRQKSVY